VLRHGQEHFGLLAVVPRPAKMSADEYTRATANPARHQVLWATFWVQTLNLAVARADAG
jgi:hypothetical protein